jgi:hypothetical protein
MDDDFTYFVKLVDVDGERYYLKSSIDERTNTILLQLTNLKLGWTGACKFDLICFIRYLFKSIFSKSTSSSNISEKISTGRT